MADGTLLQRTIRQIRIFSSLSDVEIATIHDKIAVKNYRKNATILNEDDTGHFMYMVLSGRVKVIQTTEDGREIILALHKAGDSFGELSLIDNKTSPAAVIAMEETIAALITRQNFLAILQSQQKVLVSLLLMLCQKLRESWSRLQLIHSRNASQRIRLLLYQLAREHGEQSPDGIRLNLKLTHQSLGDMSGLTREAVTRVFDRLQKDGEIVVNKDRSVTLCRALLSSLSLDRTMS